MSSINKKSALELFSEAFERLKEDRPINISPGSPLTQNNVAREAGRDPSALRAERYPELLRKIQTYIRSNKDEADRTLKSSKHRARSIEKRLADCTKQRDRLLSICLSQQNYIDELADEIAILKSNKVVNFNKE